MAQTNLVPLTRWSVALIVAVAMTVIGAGVASEALLRQETMRSAERDMANLALLFVQHAEDSIDLSDGALVGIRQQIESDWTAQGRDRMRRNLAQRRTDERIRNVYVFDENGEWVANSGATEAVGRNNSDRAYFVFHRGSRDRSLRIDKPVLARTSERWVLPLSRRIDKPDGSFGGVVLMTLDLKDLSDFFGQVASERRLAVSLLHRDGTLIVRHPFDFSDIGMDLSPARVGPAGHVPPNGITYMTSIIDGVERLMARRVSPRHPISVFATVSIADVQRAWWFGAVQRMALWVLLAGVIAGLGFRMLMEARRRAATAASLAVREAEFRLLAEGSSDLVLRLDLAGRIRYASPAAERVLGLKAGATIGRSLIDFADPDDAERVAGVLADLRDERLTETKVTFHRRAADAFGAGLPGARWLDVSLRVAATGSEQALIAVARDDTEGEETALRLASEALTDPLTGLANRRHFDAVLVAEWRRATRQGTSLALLFIDVDRFKKFNDLYGHLRGDRCLASVARAIQAFPKRPGDLVARYGGEEFVVLLPDTDLAGAKHLGEALRQAVQDLAVPHTGNGRVGVVTLSVGVAAAAPAEDDGLSPDQLARRADLALYAAKDAGRNCVIASDALVVEDDVAWSVEEEAAVAEVIPGRRFASQP
jgi:diguanylate cyclase (GGDEF)-like protein/PAS domain S-box-containing protein